MSETCAKTCQFFLHGTSADFEAVLKQYDAALKAKAYNKSSKPENVLKLDKWYQNELPKKIKSRGKDMHLTHEELVQTIKWKLARGKFRPNLVNLVQMNTPRVVMQETKKAFRNLNKKKDVQSGVNALCNLKGVGPAMASAVLAAGAPDMAPFMADECLLALPEVDGLDYTMKEYMKYVEQIKSTVDRLNAEGGSWTPHKVELAVWTYYVANDLKPELLEGIRSFAPAKNATNGEATNTEKKEQQQQGNGEAKNGDAIEEDSNMSTVSSQSADSKAEEEEPAKAEEVTLKSNGNGNGVAHESKGENGKTEENGKKETPAPAPAPVEEAEPETTTVESTTEAAVGQKRPCEDESSTPAEEPSAKKVKADEAEEQPPQQQQQQQQQQPQSNAVPAATA